MTKAKTPTPETAEPSRKVARDGLLIIGILALLKLIIHMVTNSEYGYHRDELYYIVCGQHLGAGYVDHPPVTPFLARIATTLFGESLAGLRLLPALAGAGIVFLTGLIAREMGGGRFAQILATVAVITAPLFLITNTMFQTVPFDQLIWIACVFLLMRIVAAPSRRLWITLGIVFGLGLMTKYTIVFLGLGLIVGVSLSSARTIWKDRWPWIAAAIALVFFLPNLNWQIVNGWPSIEFSRNNNAAAQTSIVALLLSQIFLIGPVALPIWLIGLHHFFSKRGESFRYVGWAYVAILVLVIVLKGKHYYIGPIYPVLLAGGAVAIERLIKLKWLRALVVATVVAGVIVPLPTLIPVLPKKSAVERGIFQGHEDFSEMLGWTELVESVHIVYNRIPEEERAQVTIFTANYGQAAAIEVLGSRDLPTPISGHNNYHFWGPGDASAGTVIALGFSQLALQRLFGKVEQAGIIANSYGVANEEFNRPVFVCHEPKAGFPQVWSALKHYD